MYEESFKRDWRGSLKRFMAFAIESYRVQAPNFDLLGS